MGFGVALVVFGGGSWWIYGFSGGGFVGFWVLEVVVVVVCVWCWRATIADGFGFLFEKITKLVFLNTLLSYAPHDLVRLLQPYPTSISFVTNKIRHNFFH